MKNILVKLLALSLIISLTACGAKSNTESSSSTSSSSSTTSSSSSTTTSGSQTEDEQNTTEEEPEDNENDKETGTSENTQNNSNNSQNQGGSQGNTQSGNQGNTQNGSQGGNQGTTQGGNSSQESTNTAGNLAESVVSEFKSNAGAGNTEAIANAIVGSAVLADAPMLGSMPVEPGFLNGFSAEISGFAEGTQFGPMIGTIPFIGYVFKLDGSMNADAFMGQLKNNADKRWNICTEADDMAMTASGDYVVFVMAPKSFEE